MGLILSALGLLIFSGFCALVINKNPYVSTRVAVIGGVISCMAGLCPVIVCLLTGQPLFLTWAWQIPFGSFSIGLDPLSALFLLPIFILSALSSIYGTEYLSPSFGKKAIGASWFFFNVLVCSMVLVVIARNAVLFLLAWEIMTIASFCLVTFESEKQNVRSAGMLYLVATHIGTAFLLVMFILLGKESGSLDFDQFQGTSIFFSSVIFVLALVGFGTKAGFMPFHVWLPEAHPAAPSHVSALMSGVMIKTGIYGLVRILTYLGEPPWWWGALLIGMGASSAVFGILFALAQTDLKKLLAYCSVENIGIIAIGLGLGFLGRAMDAPVLMVLGFTGGLFHVVNHALFKGLLFLGAGAVMHETGTREMDLLGGLLKKMPVTGLCFLIGVAAISALPLFNGFASEFLIYLGAFYGVKLNVSVFLAGLCVILALALAGGLAMASFAKAYGIVFLGEPRSTQGSMAHEVSWAMKIPMILLAVSCVVLGLAAPFFLNVFIKIIPALTPLSLESAHSYLALALQPLLWISVVSVVLLALWGGLVLLRWRILKGRAMEKTLTWDCGYAAPSVRMQYTASSFAQPLTNFFSVLLRPREKFVAPQGFFPQGGQFVSETPDVVQKEVYRRMYNRVYRSALKFRWVQHGRLQFYILYILATLLILLIWKLW